MRPSLLPAVLALAIVAPAHARQAQVSWGRAGVSFDQYRADAIACGRLGANLDIAGEPATAAFAAAERWNERNVNVAPIGNEDDPTVQAREHARMVQRLRPETRLAEVQGAHLSATEQCLTRLGYRRFALTRDQARALGRLAAGTPARHAFLHHLAADPAVLASQAVPDATTTQEPR